MQIMAPCPDFRYSGNLNNWLTGLVFRFLYLIGDPVFRQPFEYWSGIQMVVLIVDQILTSMYVTELEPDTTTSVLKSVLRLFGG